MSPRPLRSCLRILLAVTLLTASPGHVLASPDGDEVGSAVEYQVKAAFLFKLARFVEWPAHKFTQPDSPLIIGVVGTDPFGGLLEEAVQDKRINDHTVIVRHIVSMQELRKCHMIFISRSESARLNPILSEVRGDNVLTVSDSDNFTGHGGMINFIMVANRVQFQINASAASHAGLKISSKLMQLSVPTGQ